jgi:hypothetical protein
MIQQDRKLLLKRYLFTMSNQPEVFRQTRITLFLPFLVIFFTFSLLTGYSLRHQDVRDPAEDAHQAAGPIDQEVAGRDIQRGERLFQGLLPAGPGMPSCASCHNIRQTDDFSWYPTAYEIAVRYRDQTAEDLASVIMDPTTDKMIEVHEGYQLSDEQILFIKAYLDLLAEDGVRERPVITSLLLFLLVVLLLIMALADLFFLKKVRYRLVHLAIILGAGFFITATIVHEAVSIGRSQYYSPDQPIRFSHQVHVLDNQTDCLFCHSIAEYSHSAGIPSVSQCMNCHIIVREGAHSGRFEISKLVEAYENEMPVRWIRVYNLPDHVFFSHQQHVSVAGLECSECHGEVEQMHRIMQVHDMSMGWCLDCHRTREIDFTGNEFYSLYTGLQEEVRLGKMDIVTAREIGGTNCMKCHY